MGTLGFLRGLCFIAGLTAAGLASGAPATVVPTPVPRPSHTPTPTVHAKHGEVILLRGLANVFSLGMDKLAAKLHAKGIPVRVSNHSHWQLLANVLVTEYRTDRSIVPLVLIGHSLGADAVVAMGNFLATKGVPVRLVVAFDGVAEGAPVVPGVVEVINYYKPNGYGRVVKASADYKGELVNVDLSDKKDIDHLNIDKSAFLHNEVIAKVVAIFAEEPGKKKPAAKPKSAPPVAEAPAGNGAPKAAGTVPAGTAPAATALTAPAAPAEATASPAAAPAGAAEKAPVVAEPLPPPAGPAGTEPMPTTAPPPAAPDPARFADG